MQDLVEQWVNVIKQQGPSDENCGFTYIDPRSASSVASSTDKAKATVIPKAGSGYSCA